MQKVNIFLILGYGGRGYVARYRLVQRVNGPLTEGVPDDYTHDTYYIRVWAADPQANPVTVALATLRHQSFMDHFES